MLNHKYHIALYLTKYHNGKNLGHVSDFQLIFWKKIAKHFFALRFKIIFGKDISRYFYCAFPKNTKIFCSKIFETD